VGKQINYTTMKKAEREYLSLTENYSENETPKKSS